MMMNQEHESNPLLAHTRDEPQNWEIEDLEHFDAALPQNEDALAMIAHDPKLLAIKKRPDLYTVHPDVQATANAKRLDILRVVMFKIAWGNRKLPDQILGDVATEFDVSNRQVQRWMNNYIAYRYVYPASPGAEVFLPLRPGPEQNQHITEEQEKVLLGAIADRTRIVRSAIGKDRVREIPFSILDVYNLARSAFDRAGKPFPAYNTVVKFVRRWQEREPELFAYMALGQHKGRRHVEEAFLPKRRNDVSGPNKRWQSDVKESQVYVEQQGKRHTFAILIIYDDFSRYIVGWKLFLKEPKEDGSGTRGVSTRVWTTALATAMYRTNTQPENVYYDNGAYYIAADGSLQGLAADDEPGIQTSKSKAGRPEGRGKVENLFKQFETMLDRMAGRYRDRTGIIDAKKDGDPYSFGEAEQEFDKKISQWNNTPHRKDGAQTRFEVWNMAMARPAPPIRKLAQLRDIEFVYDTITFKQDYNWALQFKGMEWEPRLFHADVYTLWARAVEGRATVPLWAVKLDTGWVAEVCLDTSAEVWVEIIQKGSQPHDRTAHNEALNSSLKDLEMRRRTLKEAGDDMLMQLIGGIPVAEVSSGEYIDVLPDGKLPKPSRPQQDTSVPDSSVPASDVEEQRDTDDIGTAGTDDTAAEAPSPGYAALFQQLKARMHDEDEK
jgi:transposase InsO family protein